MRSSIVMLSLSILLHSSRIQAFQQLVKARTKRRSNYALTSEPRSVYTYADTSIIDRGGEILPFPIDEIPVPQFRSNPLVEFFGEAFGTFWIVGIGSMASMAATFVNPFMTLPQIALVWSTAVTSAILFTSPLSGAHLNPAFTIAQAMFRSFDWRKVLPYIGAQLVGSMAGSALSFEYFRSAIEGFEQAGGLTHASSIDSARVFGEYFDPSLTATQAFGVEAAGTALLAAVVFAVTHEKNSERNIPVPFVVGGAVFSLINVLAPFSQCGLNPARDFGPRIIAFIAGWTDVAFQNCWLYIAAPILGAITGAALIDKILYYPKR
uniref:Aquaporin n=1 Tax=Pseudictyota dubia TaxID=2749911 RepID=A0A7R9WEY4_9STRA|mmetsp:Transcript_47888/g.88828  ORF Transcript_47888/g.88828 Transcript_47888/m.88828 type:complete len:322 (+) Transcript_47888:74-1039(+)